MARLDHDALLAHAGWLRALAASLVADPATADDLVQETWVAALEHPPRPEWKIEAWLARVMRNFALKRRRGERRRAHHESAAASPPGASTTDPDHTLEQLDLQSTVVDAVRAIDEPFRTTIVLRYFEGRSSAEIARLQNVPPGTVRWRLKRGLDELRERLDERFEGSRAMWLGLLAPLATRDLTGPASASASSVLKGALVMNVTQIAATGAALIAVAGVVWWTFEDRSERGLVTTEIAAKESLRAPELAASSPAPSVVDAVTPASQTERATIAAPVADAEAPAPTPSVETRYTAAVDARFVDEHGLPKAGVRFAVSEDREEPTGVLPVVSGPDGRARLDLPIPHIRLAGRAGDDAKLITEWRFRLTAASDGSATVERAATLRSGEIAHLGDVVLGPGSRVHGRVVDEQGRGIAGATVGVAGVDVFEDENRTRRLGASSFHDAWTATSSADGAFVLDGVAVGTCRLWSKAEGKRYTWSDQIPVTADREVFDVELVLTPMLATDRIEGRVVDPEGNPVANASLFYTAYTGDNSTASGLRADAQGRFALVIEHDGSTYDFTANDPSFRLAQASVQGVVPGTLDVALRLVANQFLDVRVVDSDGGVVDGVKFAVSSRALERPARSEIMKDGRHRVEVSDDVSEIEVTAPGWRTERRGPLDPKWLPRELKIVMRRAPIVRGIVLADGRPLAGVHVEARADARDGGPTVNGFRCMMMSWSSGSATTDAQGRFELTCDLDGAFWIRATATGWVAGEAGPIDVARLSDNSSVDIALTKGGAIEGRVLLSGGRDAEGTIVAINHGDGLPRTVRAGPNGSFRFDALPPGHWQVLARDTEIDPGSTHYSMSRDRDPIEWSCEVVAGGTTRYDLDLTSK